MATVEREGGARFPEEELKARAAWHYYVEGLTQERISEILGVGRIKVHRILSAARDEGVVQFRIRESVVDCIAIEKRLTERYGLSAAIVVPSASDAASTPKLIGHAAASYLADNINAGDVVALGWGRTLKFAIAELPRRPIPGTTVVSMLGGLTHAQPLNPTESAWELAEKINAECYLLPVPVYADKADQRDAFMSQRSVRDVVLKARRANVAVLSVGSLTSGSPITTYGFIKPSELEALKEGGAVGDVLCHFLDADGNTVDHEVNRRVCAYPLDQLADIPHIVLVSGGAEKVPIMKAALSRVPISVLITDEDAGRGLLGE